MAAGNDITDLIISHGFSLLYHGVSPLLRDGLLPLPGQNVVEDVRRCLALGADRLHVGELHLESLYLVLESLVVLLQQSLRANLQLQQLLGGLQIILEFIQILQLTNIVVIAETETFVQLLLFSDLSLERFYA